MLEIKSRHLTWGGPKLKNIKISSHKMVTVTYENILLSKVVCIRKYCKEKTYQIQKAIEMVLITKLLLTIFKIYKYLVWARC